MMFNSVPVRIDDDLSAAINRIQPDFGAYLKRAFNNAHIHRNYVSKRTPQIIVDSTFFHDNNSDVTIKNLRTTSSESPRLMSIKADMMQDILELSVDFGALSMECEYEMINQDVMNLLPISSEGILNATIESTRAHGWVGYRITGDSLKAINFDIQYTIGQIHLEATYSKAREKMHSRSTRSSIDETIFKGVRLDIERYFEKQLRDQLNTVLQDVSLNQLFQEDHDLIMKHVTRSKSLSSTANLLIDELLVKIRQIIKDLGLSQIDIDDINKSFKFPPKSLIFVWGSFKATQGTASDLSTIYRTGDFSIHREGNVVVIFGSLGLKKLSCNYNRYIAKVWNIGPTGKISVTAGSNSAKLRIKSDGWITDIENATHQLIDIDFKVERIKNIRVYITGLGILDKIVSTINSWVIGLFNSRVIAYVDDIIKQQIEQFLRRKAI